MSLLLGHSRRRKLLLSALAFAATGYATYRLYHSPFFSLKRKQFLRLASAFSLLGDAVSEGAESLSFISRDLKSFLSSDDDVVPRSLRQAFKIGQCREFQDTVTVLSAALLRGFLQGARSKSRKDGHSRKIAGKELDHREVLQVDNLHEAKDYIATNDDLTCREIREVSSTSRNREGSTGCLDNCCVDQEVIGHGWLSPEEQSFYLQTKTFSAKSGQKEKKTSDELADRLLSKLFSEPGVGFVSAVAGTMARNFVLAFFDASSQESAPGRNFSFSSNNHLQATKAADGSRFLDMVTDEKCRVLIAECIKTFVGTAVTVYIERTKDVNFYDEMIAGITNPSHKDPMKDVLMSVCNGAIDTFVRTSYDVTFSDKWKQGRGRSEIQAFPFPSSSQQRLTPEPELLIQSERRSEESTGEMVIHNNTEDRYGGISGVKGGTNTFIEGVSRTLAIPSNRQLLVDVAGKMSSEAVRSCFQVVSGTVRSHFQSKTQLQLHGKSSAVAAKAFIFATICLAICLHVLTVLHLSQKA